MAQLLPRRTQAFPAALSIVVTLIIAMVTWPVARAADLIWANAGTDWGTPSNWIPPGPPGTGDTGVFNTFSTGGILINPDVAAAFALQSVTIGGGPNLGDYTFTGAGSLTLSASATGGILTMRGNQTTTFNGPSLNGFSATNTMAVSGGFGANLVLTGNSVANTNIGTITLRGGSVVADNSGVNPGTQRLASAANPALTGGGSGFVFKGNAAGSTFNGLTGTVQVNAGDGYIRVEQPSGAAAATVVNFGGITRNNTNTTVNFLNSGSGTLGAGGVNPTITFTTAPTVRQGVISTSAATTLPFAFVSQDVGGGVIAGDWANYAAGTGVVAATTTTFTGDFNGATAGTNVKFVPTSAGTVTLQATANQLATVNLAPGAAGVTLDVTGTRMNTFGVMVSGGTDITVNGGELFTAGTGTRTLIVTSPNTALSTNSLLATTNNPVNKSGAGFAILTGTTNQIAFPAGAQNFNLNGGTLRVTSTNFDMASLTAPVLRLRGGTLEYDVSGGSFTFDRALGVAAGQFNWANAASTTQLGSGGFSAFSTAPGNTLNVNIGGAGQALTWNGTVGADANFVQSGYALQFGSLKSNATVVWQNPINLDGGSPTTYALRTIEVTQGVGNTADRTRMSGIIAGSASTDLVKVGTGTLEFTAANTYAGRTIVQGGTLLVNNATGSGTGIGSVKVKNGGRIGGSGTIAPGAGGDVEIDGTIAPGNSAGALTIGQSGTPTPVSIRGRYSWELESAGGPAAPNTGASSASAIQDSLTIFGNVTGNVVVDLTALGNTGFIPTVEYSWTIVSATAGFTGNFNVGSLNGADFQGIPGFFFINSVGPNLYLNYSPVPEPATVLIIGAGGFAVIGGFRRWRQRSNLST